MTTTHTHTHARKHNGHARHLLNKKIAAFTLRKARSRIAKTTARLTNQAYDAQEKLMDMEKNLAVYVKKNPLKSVGLSVLAGITFAQFLRIFRR